MQLDGAVNVRWAWRVLALELKKMSTYRVEFWSGVLGNIAIQLITAYFLWSTVYEQNKVAQIGGYAFGPMMFYYFMMKMKMKMMMN